MEHICTYTVYLYNINRLCYFDIFTGATKDIGSALTRLCMRHRNIEAKLKLLTKYVPFLSNFTLAYIETLTIYCVQVRDLWEYL